MRGCRAGARGGEEGTEMQVGIHIPQVGRGARPEIIQPFAVAAEGAGFDALWVFDHVVFQRELGTKYPYADDGGFGFAPTADYLEAVSLLAYLAGVTQRIRLGTSVLVVPMRPPVLLAKMIASINRLSNGRLELGVGAGWWKEEFAVLDAPFDRRGQRLEEHLALMRALWRDEWTEFEGPFHRVVGWTSNPKPERDIPIWIGGESETQLRRAGTMASGWLATTKSLPTLDQDFGRVKQAAEAAGRDPEGIGLGMEFATIIRGDGLEQSAQDLAALEARGVTHAICTLHSRWLQEAEEVLQRFGEQLAALRLSS